MHEINSLVKILDTLLAPDGCPWDQKQTLATIKTDLLEEACELIDAIESQNKVDIKEEIGDVLFVVLFLLRLAEKENIAAVKDIVSATCEKLIRRHPHIFEEKKDLTDEELLLQWDAIKSQEKKVPRHPLDRIPKALPSLSKAAEILKAVEKHNWDRPEMTDLDSDMALGNSIFELVERAHVQGIDPEVAFRKYLAKYGEILRS
jgi:tetrapyrrole methylase family protein/MazG family protein